jgi:hypothetical protein
MEIMGITNKWTVTKRNSISSYCHINLEEKTNCSKYNLSTTQQHFPDDEIK